MTLRSRLLALLAIALSAIAVTGSAALAHSGKQSYIYISTFDDGVDGRIEIPSADLAAVLGLDFGSSGAAAARTAEANAATIRTYVSEHFALGDGQLDWALEFGDVGILPEAGNYVVVDYVVDRELFDAAPRSFVVEFDAIIHANDQKDALLHIENDWDTGTFANESDPIANFSAAFTVQEIDLDDGSIFSSIAGARGVGTDAVRTGIDQLLFVVALVLPIGLAALGSTVFAPAPALTDVARRTGRLFTISLVAQSATLWLVGLGVVGLSARTTSILVAAALLVLAASAMWPASRRHEDVLVGAVSLLAGLGLGTAYLAARLDRYSGVMPLVGFNLGVVTAAVVITALTFAVVLPLRRTVIAPVALYGTASVLCVYAIGWLIERLGDRSLSMEKIANPLRVWPRNLWIILALALAAAAFFMWSASRGRLRPIAGPTDDSIEETPIPDESLVSQ